MNPLQFIRNHPKLTVFPLSDNTPAIFLKNGVGRSYLIQLIKLSVSSDFVCYELFIPNGVVFIFLMDISVASTANHFSTPGTPAFGIVK